MSGTLKEKFLLFKIRVKKDPNAFGEIYDHYVRQIYRFIFFKVSRVEVAEDLTSDTFLKAWQYLKEKREVSSLQALLYSVARSVVIDHYRSTAVERMTISINDDDSTLQVSDEKSAQLIRDVEAGVDIHHIIETLRKLKDEYREVIVMKYLDGLSTSEIGQSLGKSAGSVRVLIHRALKVLTEHLHDNNKHEQTNPAKIISKNSAWTPRRRAIWWLGIPKSRHLNDAG